MSQIRPFTKTEYAVYCLKGLARMIQRYDFFKAFVPPRLLSHEDAKSSDVIDILNYAIECVLVCAESLPDEPTESTPSIASRFRRP